MNEPLTLGIDLGTGGVRAMVATADGRIVAQNAVANETKLSREEGRHEQLPHDWWQNVRECLGGVVEELKRSGFRTSQVQGMAVDGTSGTLVALDANDQPVRPAIMYNDPRPSGEALILNDLARSWCERAGYRFEPSFALAKIMWMARNEEQHFVRAARFVHQADYIVGQLTGDFGVTDYSNALKTGYDLIEEKWPAWMTELPGVTERLPRVVAPGAPVGTVTERAAEATGLPVGLTVLAGATDGVAAAVAAGVRKTGDYNTTLGTTLVFKGVTERLMRDPQGLIYSHKLPGGKWLPGAASNTGSSWIRAWFGAAPPAELDRAAREFLPGRLVGYPLVGRGERFPFQHADAERFMLPDPVDANEAFAGFLVGTAIVERLAYEVLDSACGTTGGAVYSTGGGSKSDVWMQCRADVTQRVLHRPAVAESAFGSTILAAAGTVFSSLAEATAAMAKTAHSFAPETKNAAQYDDLFRKFRAELERRGYLAAPP
ncbi:MAG TPA: FGGY-family carbohydrate kinase [Pirellulales bacterium]|jgi:xylulokinase